MNANTILAFRAGTERNQLADQTGDFTTATAAVINAGSTTAVAVLRVPLQTPILGAFNPLSPNANSAVLGSGYGRAYGRYGKQAPFFNSDAFDGIPFRVRVSGKAATATVALQTLLIELSLQATGTYAAGTVIASTGAPFACAVTGGVYFSIVAECLWTIGTGSNGNLASRHSATIAKLPTPARQVVSDVIQTNVTMPCLTASALNFVVFATAAQVNTCTLHYDEFALELI
jgi:hypothetical protein